jgi:peptide deformylase
MWRILFLFLCVPALAQFPRLQPGFTPQEQALILNGDTTTMLRVTQTTDAADLKILSSLSTDILPTDPLLGLLAKRMYLSVTDVSTNGVGIAAPQVGINRNAIWVKRFDKPGQPFEFYVNPKIAWKSELLQLGAEGCLSIPEARDQVIRSYAIQISYSTLNGAHQTEAIEGFTAVIFQHEIDHLYGVLFPQRVDEQNTQVYQKSEAKGKVLLYPASNTKRL